jgi:hypothetical protein
VGISYVCTFARLHVCVRSPIRDPDSGKIAGVPRAEAENSSRRGPPVRVHPVRNTTAPLAAIVVALGLLAATVSAHADPMSTSPEQAYDLGEVPTARAVGMGGALNALGVSTTSLYLNPANMSLARVYHLEALVAVSPESSRQTYGLAIVDSILNSSHVAGGLGGTWSTLDPNGIHRTWTDARGAVSLPIGDHLSVGTAVRWLRVEQNVGSGPFGASPASGGTSGAPIFSGLTFDAGATGSLDGFRLAVVGRNLTNPGTALAPTTAVAGFGYFNETFALEADGLLDFTTWGSTRGRVMGGGELFLADRYAVRLGWRYDAGTKLNSPSIGLGYIDPRWSIEVGIRHDLVSDHASTLGVISLRYFYDPTGSTSPADQSDSF